MTTIADGDRVEFTGAGALKVGDSRPGVVVSPYDGCQIVSVRHDDGSYTTDVWSWWLRKKGE